MEHLQGWEFLAMGVFGAVVGFACGAAHVSEIKNRIIVDLQRALERRVHPDCTRRGFSRAQFNEESV